MSGTEELKEDDNKYAFRALYRRFHHTIELTHLSEQDITQYFRGFLKEYLPSTPDEVWSTWEERFCEHVTRPWKDREVSVDMLKQFLTRQVTDAAVALSLIHI